MKNVVINIILVSCSLFLMTNCKKERKSNDNKIISLTLLSDSASKHPPVIKIVDTIHTIFISVGNEHDITNLKYSVKLPFGAILVNQPNNLQNVEILTIEAEDGTVQNYKMIVTKVTGSVTITQDILEKITLGSHEMPALYECPRAYLYSRDNVGGVFIYLESCKTDVFSKDYNALRLSIFTQHDNPNLIGTYTVNNSISSSFKFGIGNGNGYGYSESPIAGKITITAYDKTNKVISGSFSDVQFKHLEKTMYSVSGTFHNVPTNFL